MNGQPCIRNLRLIVCRLIERLVTDPDREEWHQELPELEEADIQQALIFMASYLEQGRIMTTLDTDFHTLLTLDTALSPSIERNA